MACHQVLVEVGFLGEARGASRQARVGTLERSLARVRAQVVQEVVQFGKQLAAAANVTLKELFLATGPRIAVLKEAERPRGR